MQEIYRQYVEKSKQQGCKTERRYANGLDYLFIYERDGWISIMDVTGGIYKPIIQSKDLEHAESYIALREPIPPFVKFIRKRCYK